MTETNVFQLSQLGTFADPLTEVLRNGARAMLAQAVEAEVAALLASHSDRLTDDGRQRLVRHGHLPEREVMTGIGPVAVRCPRVRDRVGKAGERIRFSSAYTELFEMLRDLPVSSLEQVCQSFQSHTVTPSLPTAKLTISTTPSG